MVRRTEHPKPQFQRDSWENLNGEWAFEFDNGNSGEARKLFEDGAVYSRKINVPFCPQSKLSGIEEKDFMSSVWYKREFNVSEERKNGRVFLHIGACDYKTTVYVNGTSVGTHVGGYVSFKFEITDYVKTGVNTLCVHAEDDERNRMIPHGKQCSSFYSKGCSYTRTTGIWQTVWLEFTPVSYIQKFKLLPSLESNTLTVVADVKGNGVLAAKCAFDGKDTGSATVSANNGQVVLTVSLSESHPWELGKGGLYDLTLSFGEDVVHSYFGLRSIAYYDKKFFLNGKSVFQRTILDQGFYPDGIYTAPEDKELENDIKRSMAMGFNGARLHQKVFEERFLYYADKHGYLIWGEYPSWGLDHSYADSIYGILPEWLAEVERDFNHPSIIGWCPFNETWDINGRKQWDALLALVYQATKAADSTRPCIDTSGNFHVPGYTDIYDMHDYNQNPEILREHFINLPVDGTYTENNGNCKRKKQELLYDKKLPFFVSEYGGIFWSELGGWGYGEAPKTQEEFLERLKGLTDVLLDNPAIFAFCYTQLTDVEQEQNGLYTYDRQAKFPPEVIAEIISRKAAVEE